MSFYTHPAHQWRNWRDRTYRIYPSTPDRRGRVHIRRPANGKNGFGTAEQGAKRSIRAWLSKDPIVRSLCTANNQTDVWALPRS